MLRKNSAFARIAKMITISRHAGVNARPHVELIPSHLFARVVLKSSVYMSRRTGEFAVS